MIRLVPFTYIICQPIYICKTIDFGFSNNL